MILIKVENLVTRMRNGAHFVDDISFDIAAGETFAPLGESDCGKSMTKNLKGTALHTAVS